MEYTSKYKAEEIEAILDAKNNTGEAVDETLDGLFVDALQTKEVELSESAEITPDEGFLGLKKVNVTVKGGDAPSGGSSKVRYFNVKPLIDMDLTQASGLLKRFPGLLAVKAKADIMGDLTSIVPMAAMNSTYYNAITEAAILDNFRGFIENSNDLNSSDIIPQLLQFGCTEITEEQFYTI